VERILAIIQPYEASGHEEFKVPAAMVERMTALRRSEECIYAFLVLYLLFQMHLRHSPGMGRANSKELHSTASQRRIDCRRHNRSNQQDILVYPAYHGMWSLDSVSM
jgi:hypothetical protein